MVAEHGAVPQPSWRLRGTPSRIARSEPATPTATVASPLPVPTTTTLLNAGYAERLEALERAVHATQAVETQSVIASAGPPLGIQTTTTQDDAANSTGNFSQRFRTFQLFNPLTTFHNFSRTFHSYKFSQLFITFELFNFS